MPSETSQKKEYLLRVSNRLSREEKSLIYTFIVALVLPYSIAFSLGGLVLTPLRAYALFCFAKLFTWLKGSSRHMSSALLMDCLVVFHCFWVMLAIMVHHGLAKGLESGGIYIVEFLPLYAFGRYVGEKPVRIQLFTSIFFRVVMIIAPLAYIESFTGTNLVKLVLGKIGFGAPQVVAEQRFGLDRASASLPHPILYGLFASSMAGMACYILKGSKTKKILAFFAATFPALSSAPLLSISIQMGLISWDYILRKNAKRWFLLIGMVVFCLLVIDLLSNRDAITVLMHYLTFNAQTGYWRKLIWEYGLLEVQRYPFLGIGFNDWARPEFMHSSSVDTFWLLTAMRYGIPAVLSLIVVKFIAIKRMTSKKYYNYASIRIGWLVSMVGMIFVGITVHFWANSFALYAVMLGLGVSISCYKFTPSLPETANNPDRANRSV